MWSRRTVLTGFGGLLATGALGGCGFRPLYGRTGDGNFSEVLAQVEIGPIPDRVGQIVRNALLERLTPKGTGGLVNYRLDVLLNESISSLAVQKSADATRADLTLSATYALTDIRSGKVIQRTNSQAVASFNILNSEFATLMAEKGARDRAARQLSDEIRLKVAIFLRSQISG